MRTLFVAALFAVASFDSAYAAGGCGAGFHRGPYGGCVVNRGGVVVAPAGGVVVAPAPVVVAPAPVVVAPGRVCPYGTIWRAGACRPI
jgi:hypothetical protein